MITFRLFILSVLSISLLNGQEKKRSPEERYFEDLVKAYNFVIVQEEALKAVARQFPELAPDVDQVVAEQKKSSLGTAIAALKKEIGERLGNKMDKTEQDLRQQIAKNDLSVPLTQNKARTMAKQYAKVKDGLVLQTSFAFSFHFIPNTSKRPPKKSKTGGSNPLKNAAVEKPSLCFSLAVGNLGK